MSITEEIDAKLLEAYQGAALNTIRNLEFLILLNTDARNELMQSKYYMTAGTMSENKWRGVLWAVTHDADVARVTVYGKPRTLP